MPISLYGVLDLSRVLFSTLLGVVVLDETLGFMKTLGLIFVSSGLLLLKYRPPFLKSRQEEIVTCQTENEMPEGSKQKKEMTKTVQNAAVTDAGHSSDNVKTIYIVFAFLSCILNALSGLMDKILMKDMNSSQLQFWYMLFMVIYYGIYMIATKTKLSKNIWKNGWIWLLSILFVMADKALFIANGMAESQVTIMTLLKQSGCVVTILAGKFIFKEKKAGYKLFCAAVIVVGIVIGVM